MLLAKQSTAFTVTIGPILDSTGAEYTGAVIGDLTIRKHDGSGAAMASAATLTHVDNGHYTLVGTTGNSDTLGRVQIRCNKSTYQMPPFEMEVVTAAVYATLIDNGTLASTTSGRTIVTDAAGLVDANTVKVGPTGSGTAQTAGDIPGRLPAALGANGNIKADVRDLLATAWLTPGTAGTPDVNVKLWNALSTVALPLVPTTAGRTLDVAATGEAGLDFDNIKAATGATTLTNIRVPNVTLADTVTTYTGNTLQTGDNYARLGAPAGASVSADVAAVKTDTGNLVTRITANLFSGITKLSEWLGAIAGKQTGNSTARTEIRASGAGSGTFDETTDSQEAIRDRGDAAWVTGAGGSAPTVIEIRQEMDSNSTKLANLDATISSRTKPADTQARVTIVDTVTTNTDMISQANIRTAVGLATANLDTQIAAVQADTDNIQTRIPAALTGAGNIKSDAQVNSDKTGYALTSAYEFAKGTVAMTESYNADGAAPTPVQSLMGIMQMLMEMSAAGTVVTVKKLDGTTTAFTLTTNDATLPTSVTRAT